MSSHHPTPPPPLQLQADARAALTGATNGAAGTDGIDDLFAHFHDQQTGQIVEATPLTAERAGAYAPRRRRTVGAAALTGPAPAAGDWVVIQGDRAAPLQAAVVVGPDFLRRFYPADAHAQALLKYLGVMAGGAGAGAPAVAARRVTDVLTA